MTRFWLLPLFAASLLAADVSGKWTGTVDVEDPSDGTNISTPVRAELEQKADAISGKIGRQEDSEADTQAIRNASLQDGTRLIFEVASTETNGLVKFALKLDGDHLDGEMSGTMDGVAISGKVHLTRLK
ncbi:MAG TPA: hypothetical protein VKR61_16065 [Bryobacteraceae bacterium]|nr:hypothetical protein [Bryobacteraceae bacterium]